MSAVRYAVALSDVCGLGRALAFSENAFTDDLGIKDSRLYCVSTEGSQTTHMVYGRR